LFNIYKKKYVRKILKCCSLISLKNKISAVSHVPFSNAHGFTATGKTLQLAFPPLGKYLHDLKDILACFAG